MDFYKLPIEVTEINSQLMTHFGIDSDTGKAMWRVAWSNDQYEMRRDSVTEKGITLLYPQVMEMAKYPWAKNKWMLERLVLVPIIHESDLPGLKQSYECMHAFPEGIIPSFRACKFVVDTVYAALGKKSMAKYIDEEARNPVEVREARLRELENELFGDETGLMGKTISGEAIIVPHNYAKETE